MTAGLFKSFIIYRQLLFFWCFCVSEIHGKDPTRVSATDPAARGQGVDPHMCISELEAPPDAWSCADAGDRDCVLPRRQTRRTEDVSFHSLPLRPSFPSFPVKAFWILLSTFCLARAWKDSAIVSGHHAGGSSNPHDCWTCHEADGPVAPLSIPPSPRCPGPWGSISGQQPQTQGRPHPGSVQRKGRRQVTRTKPPSRLQTLQFYWPPWPYSKRGCHTQNESPEPHSKRITRSLNSQRLFSGPGGCATRP